MLEGMTRTDLKIISSDLGSVMHGMKKSAEGFNSFGELYFSTVEKGAIKAWKLHKEMTLNLIVPVGRILICFMDPRKQSSSYNKLYKVILSQNPYFRLTVPRGIWFGFMGVGASINMLANVADIEHDPDEVLRKEIDEIEIDWSIE
jgi:dTDP-4-dehydrorhamnose 3,5-epimerase